MGALAIMKKRTKSDPNNVSPNLTLLTEISQKLSAIQATLAAQHPAVSKFTYRTSGGPWGAGKDAPLSYEEVDANYHHLEQLAYRMEQLYARMWVKPRPPWVA
jgi:hypothetical protein